jgi:hypothetical protein
VLFLSSTSVQAANVTWVGTVTGFWDTASNWNTNSLPQPGDDVTINRAVTVFLAQPIDLTSITLSGNAILDTSVVDITCSKLILNAGTIKGTGTLTVTNSFLWL